MLGFFVPIQILFPNCLSLCVHIPCRWHSDPYRNSGRHLSGCEPKALTFQESIYPYHNCLVYGLALQSVVFLYCIAYKSELRENLTYAFPLVVKQGAKVPSETRNVRNQYISGVNVLWSEKIVYREVDHLLNALSLRIRYYLWHEFLVRRRINAKSCDQWIWTYRS